MNYIKIRYQEYTLKVFSPFDKIAPGTHYTGDWVCPRINLNSMVK